ncbi:DEDDh 3'-5' exonuclease domain protein [Hokovirus HKV1]|mgnify:CR=1 FL=1|uniref:DEDDh 3'-5' exonuclease domain protein n=1 Tax=Hokovirus HKV1 TaxID=1977638 RepID=A0A1V0SGV7_9VIRU|nr:DEDDh 3'-5' exonuclease domain protein [Hokovirus HKV1]
MVNNHFFSPLQLNYQTQHHDYRFICVLDFEATCDDVSNYDHEIIEFSSLLLRYSPKHNNYITESTFKKYCKPKINSTLTKFCTNLTGITQQQVNNASNFPQILEEHKKWIKEKCGNKKPIIATVGKYDLEVFMYNDCKKWNINNIDDIYKQFIDVNYIFQNFYNIPHGGLKGMLKTLNIESQGNSHNGLDDCINTAQIIIRMVDDGFIVKKNLIYNITKYYNIYLS